MTPREILAARLAELVDAARKLPHDGVVVAERAGVDDARWATGGRVFAVRTPKDWPAELPLPLTAGEALARVEAGARDILDELDEEISRMAEILVAPELRAVVDLEAVARAWPWPDRRDVAPDRALALLTAHALGHWPGLTTNPPPWYYRDREIALWAAERMEHAVPRYGTKLRAWRSAVGDWADVSFADGGPMPVLTLRAGGQRWPGQGIALLWAAERDARRRVYALDAAAEVRERLAELVDARNPGPEIFAALDVATEGEPLAAGVDASTRGGWAGALLTLAQGVAGDVLALAEPTTEDDARAAADAAAGMVADALAKLGPAGRDRAATVRQRAAARAADVRAGGLLAGELWTAWRGTAPAGWLRALAEVLWADVWRPERVRMTRPVALPRATVGAVVGLLSAVKVATATDGGEVLVNPKGDAVARFLGPRLVTAVHAEALEALALSGVGELASVIGGRFVAWFAHEVQRRPDPRAPLVYVGGDGVNAYGTLAERLGMNPRKDADRVRAFLWALQFSRMEYPDGGEAGLLLLDFRPGGGRGKVSTLTITPGRPWQPDDVFTLPNGAEHRALAPIPALPGHSPPFVGDRRERGPVGRLWLRILSELAHGSDDIARGLGAPIPGARWAALAREEGVMRPPPLLVGLLQDRWTQDGNDGPAILERVGPDRWHLGPAFAAERSLLEDGGKERIGASEGGKRSAAERRAARVRLAEGAPGKRRRKPKGG